LESGGTAVLDTHVGSASSLVAYYRNGINYIGCEIDSEYYKSAKERLDAERSQLTLFDLGMERPT
jgi:site-specific DNA-methyltransferase (adenine-specific)